MVDGEAVLWWEEGGVSKVVWRGRRPVLLRGGAYIDSLVSGGGVLRQC